MAVSGLPRQLVEGNPVHIGTVGSGALVRVDCVDAINIEIKSQREGFGDVEWWISNRGSATDVRLNGERLERSTRLTDGDRISVADVVIRYSGGWLREDHNTAQGVTVSVRGLSDERDDKVILREVSFIAHEGEFVGILGPSGCGKSSVIQRIAGLASFSGHISINGHSVGEDDLRRLIAYLPQNVENALHDGLTVREEMDCNRRLFLAANTNDEDIDSACLKTLNLETEADKPIGKLSGGQKRRVAIALALQRQPQLLLLDEPTAGLDPATETEVMQYLQRLARQGRTVLCATHVMENLKLFDKVLVLTGGEENGKSVYFGTPAGLLEHFGVASYPDMYLKLRDESKRLEKLCAGDSLLSESWDLPEVPQAASFVRTVGGYLSRSWKDFRAAFVRPTTWWDLIRPIWLILLQPALIAIGINWACADKFLELPIGGGTGVVIVLFCAGLSVFWLGLVGCAQSLVRERIPGRCLERLGGVSVWRYCAAKLLMSIWCCLVKVSVFVVLLYNLDGWIKWFGGTGFLVITKDNPSLLSWSWGIVWTLFFLCVMGGVVGLVVSSICQKATTAVAVVPIIAVLALFFSQPVIQFKTDSIKGESSTEYSNVRVNFSDGLKGLSKSAVWFAEWVMPCHKAQVLMTVMNEQANGKHRVFSKDELFSKDEELKKNVVFNRKLGFNVRKEFLIVFGGYAFIFILLAIVGQWWREHAWNGR